ncbi:hypothetical protein P8S54_10670 [Thiomicrospira sp. R3]|uniref:hypothetical protein n=1 Tax=Thiomicrospira sp. R3 TaxID=3035472 RepID=UPI00259BA2A2|nr:hypothetical protein [Thiomicrospira sp. R3]WFE68656.1 hypothetical protein P8S54_10670 [Thiomicrospira sp. R3]
MWEINPAWFLLLTLIGLVILAVFAYLKRQSYRLSRTLSQLYQLNQQLNQDPINLINQAWPLLKPIGINGYQAQVIWFGDKLDLQNGELKGRQQAYHLNDQLSNQDIQIDFSFYTPNLSGERRYFAQLVQQTFIHLLEHNIQTKINQILTTQAGVQRAQVFAQHDLKNLMQFINLLNSQLKKTTQPEQEHRLLQSLKHSVPSLQQRAERILSNLQPPHEPNNTTQPYTQHSETPQPIQLAHFIDQLAQPLFMPYEIQGDAHL